MTGVITQLFQRVLEVYKNQSKVKESTYKNVLEGFVAPLKD